MFTGIIDDVGIVHAIADGEAGRELTIRSSYSDVQAGESIAVSGVCLTVREASVGVFTVAAVTTTLDRTAIGSLGQRSRVNLERAMRASDRLGGHIVQGHVDEVGVVRDIRRRDDALLIDVEVTRDMFSLLVPHGSITIDGVSLTVNELPADNIVQLSLIEYTLRHTTLADLSVGSRVNVEGDVIGKYVRRLAQPYAQSYVETTHG